MSFISLFDIISVVVPDLKIFLWNLASAVEVTVVNPNGIKKLLFNGVSTFFINGKLTFINGQRSLRRNPSNFIFLDTWYILMSYLEKHFEGSWLVYQAIKDYVEKYFHQFLSCMMIILALSHLHFLRQTLIHSAENLIT